ncbi:MAG: DUF4012 domain-containing protein, partial [Marmoricola sp.]
MTRRQVGVVVLVLVFFALGYFVWQAYTASRALLDARDEATTVSKLIKAGDFDGANRALGDLRQHTRTAHSRTSGPLWDVTRHIPYLGRNIGAVQTVSEVLDTATRINAPIALQLSQALNEGKFKPDKGQIDLATVKSLTPQVTRAATSIDQAGRDLDELNADSLIFPFNDLVGDLQDQVGKARTAATATATAFDLMPAMLGSTEPRNYLLMIQNPAELRSTGGLPGSLAILHAEGGRLTMGWQGSAGDINPFTGPVVQLPKDTASQYGPTVASDFRDINFTPDFPEAAQIARTMVKKKLDIAVDGVLSVDPIALGYLMTGTGPINVGNGVTLNAATVTPTLLNQTYKAIQDPTAQDDFFETVARKIFDAVLGGQGSQQFAITGLATATEQHRVLLWSDRAEEQKKLAGTAVGGALPGRSGTSPQVGMYIND